jgi:hypothetical protein
MKYGPGSSGAKCAIFITSWMDGVELEAGVELGVDIKVVVGVGGALSVGFAVAPGPELPQPTRCP